MGAVRRLQREAPWVPARPGGTHIVLCLQVARLLAQEAKHTGEVLVPYLAEDLQRAPQLLHTRPITTCAPRPSDSRPFPAQPPPGAPRSAGVTHYRHGTWAGLTLSWALSSTLMLLSEEVTSGPKSTLPAGKDEE